jgi:trk system potassium uptake protein TrkA
MNILIVGAGVVGANLAEELSLSGHNVSIVDRDVGLVRRLKDRMDVLAVAGNAGQPSVLRKAGIEDAEMVIAVTNIDEVNLVICMLARTFGVKHKIARIRNEEYAGRYATLDPAQLGIDSIINPESLIITNLLNILDIPGSCDVATFGDGQVVLVTFDVSSEAPLAGRRLAELREASQMDQFLVVAIFRGETPLIPKGDDEIHPGDQIAVLVNADTLPLVLPLIQRRVQQPQRVAIYGANLIGLGLALSLEGRVDRVVLIEPDAERAEAAAMQLKGALVLQGAATEPEILDEADIARCDFFMAMSDDDESNLLSALMARRRGATRVAVLSQEPDYLPVLRSIGLDVVVNPRLVTVGEILRYIRKGPVHTVTRLRESEAEVMELEATPGSHVVQRPLKEIGFPNGSIIGAVVRRSEVFIPDGNFQIESGDSVVVFALPEAIKKIEKLFSKKGLLG